MCSFAGRSVYKETHSDGAAERKEFMQVIGSIAVTLQSLGWSSACLHKHLNKHSSGYLPLEQLKAELAFLKFDDVELDVMALAAISGGSGGSRASRRNSAGSCC